MVKIEGHTPYRYSYQRNLAVGLKDPSFVSDVYFADKCPDFRWQQGVGPSRSLIRILSDFAKFHRHKYKTIMLSCYLMISSWRRLLSLPSSTCLLRWSRVQNLPARTCTVHYTTVQYSTVQCPHLCGRGLGVRVGGEPRAPLRRDHRLALPQQEGPRGPPRDVAAAVRSHLDTSSAQLLVQSFIYFGKLGNEIFDIDIIFSYRRITFYICHISRMHFCRKLHSVK